MNASHIAILAAMLACGSGGGEDARLAEPPPVLEADLAAARLEIATLHEALREERAERQALELEVERLHEELDQLAWSEAGKANEAGEDQDQPWFDETGLLEHGVEPAEVERLRETFGASELALLELENRARREGWFREPRYREELRDMRLALRAELGDDRFDRLLYATGRQNRVVVSDVLDGSAAQGSGLQPGDEILSYDDRRIFRPMELKQATTEGRAGERVAVELWRDGSRFRVWLPRGPIGIRMDPQRRPPLW